MPTSLILGSGPAAAGVAAALLEDPRQRVTVVDLGTRLEPDHDDARRRLAAAPEETWSQQDLAIVGQRPELTDPKGLPQKQSYGSDFPFRDLGQLAGVHAIGEANAAVVSAAYGGFSNVWGAQIMPFSQATLDRWPIGPDALAPHYAFAQREMSLAAEPDDLDELFPLPADHQRLPPLAHRTRLVLERYESRRAWVQSHGVTVGRARLAFAADDCTRCGLCMTGCPYRLIYSAAHTFERLQADPRLVYRPGLLAYHLEEIDGIPRAHVRDVATDRQEVITADRVFVACGGLGTTQLVLGSRGVYDRPVHLAESVQFVMPAVSARPAVDPRTERRFTLNQFNLVYDASGDGRDLCQIHFYPYNELFLDALPAVLRHRRSQPLTTALLRRLSVGLGYVPSWGSPQVRVVASRAGEERLPNLSVSRAEDDGWPPMLKQLSRALLRVAPALDLWPVLPKTTLSAAAKSYHFGGSFPHADGRTDATTDRLGRLAGWDNIHLVDAAVFPDVPATTFTLTVMANAHRIATETCEQLA